MDNNQERIGQIKEYLIPATLEKIHCIDERQMPEGIRLVSYDKNGEKTITIEPIEVNGVEIPGATYGIIQAVATVSDCSLEEAKTKVLTSGIPLWAHTDTHHGAHGCGYGKLCENDPQAVGAKEQVEAKTMLSWIMDNGGKVYELEGNHLPGSTCVATINYEEGKSVDSDQVYQNHNLGVFNYDYWAAQTFGDTLGIDGKAFADHLKEVFVKTVHCLGVETILELQEQ